MSDSHLGPTAATPGRRTIVTFDVPETVLVEPPWGELRGPQQIHKASFDGVGESYGVMQLASGWWGLEPINAEFFEQHETLTEPQAGLLNIGDFNGIPEIALIPMHRRPDDLPGVLAGASADLQDENDSFFHILRPGGASYQSAVVSALPEPPVPKSLRNLVSEEHIVLDRVLEGVTQIDADTGYLLRWRVPGNPFSKPDWAMRFYFGGALTDEGLGQFCLLLGGNGTAVLYERQDDTGADSPAIKWVERDTWRFANPQSTVNVVHQMRVIPHAGRFIEFSSQLVDRSFSLLTAPGAKFISEASDTTKHLHIVTPDNAKKRAPGQRRVTGKGPVHFSVRRDLPVQWQVARLVYRTDPEVSGQLVDSSMNIPWGVQAMVLGDMVNLAITRLAVQTPDPLDSAVRLKLYDGETHAELASDPVEYSAPGGLDLIVPKIEFATQDAYHSPYMFSYAVSRPKFTKTQTPGAFSGGIVQSVSITGPDNDPTHETAHIVMHDVNGTLSRLAERSLLSVEIKTEYDGDPEKTAVLFRGYARSPRRRPMGRTGMEFPSPAWSEYEIDCIGQWRRLQASLILRFDDLANVKDPGPDEDARNKVTDVIRKVLGDAGYDDDQLDVPDNETRMWAGDPSAHPTEIWIPSPGTRALDYAQRIAFDYLGAYLLFDANAGTKGAWRLKFQPQPEAPLWSFLTEIPDDGIPRLSHSLASYADGTSPVLRVEGQMTLVYWIEPPEGNAVMVTAMGTLFPQKGTQIVARSWAINRDSVDWPAFGTQANPDSADYLGWFEPIVDWPVGLIDQNRGRDVAAFITKRLYDFACRARKMASWTSHLVLVEDPGDPLLGGRRRPLRYGDSVTVGGEPFFIRSCNVEMEHDHVQLASYVGQAYPTPQ